MKKYYQTIKRVQDVVLAVAALLTLFPLMLVTAVVIYIDDPHGSPFFSQTRIGKDGKPFKLYKFRSMYVDAEERKSELHKKNEMSGPAFKIKDDPRVTRAGRFIRKSCMDELPQLWNILLGDMSFVGPRPSLPEEVQLYNEKQKARLTVIPGLTCYWQVQPNRHSMSFDQWVAWDLKYIKERCLWTDWKIMWKTVRVIVRLQGD